MSYALARGIVQERVAAAEARARAETEERGRPAQGTPTEISALDVLPAASSITSACAITTSTSTATSAVASTSIATASTACTVASEVPAHAVNLLPSSAACAITTSSSTITATTAAVASTASATASTACTVESEVPAHAVDVVALAATLNDHDSNFDSSANRSRRWRLQNPYGCRDNNREGHKRRKLREQQLTSPERRELRERRADAVRECRERDREAARRYGLKPSDQRWKEIKDERWQREQKQSTDCAETS
jgi:hypothetical protein